jgi:transposase-like protein
VESPFRCSKTHKQRYCNNLAAGFAKYVSTKSAPARRIEVKLSIMARSQSIHPLRAAAMIMANSPLT